VYDAVALDFQLSKLNLYTMMHPFKVSRKSNMMNPFKNCKFLETVIVATQRISCTASQMVASINA